MDSTQQANYIGILTIFSHWSQSDVSEMQIWFCPSPRVPPFNVL